MLILAVMVCSSPTLVRAQFNPPLGIQDEGGSESKPVFTIDCVGEGVSCTHSGITGTITVGADADNTLAEVLTAGNEGGGTDMVIDDADLHISNTSLADTTYSQTTEGVLLSGGGMNTTFKYTPGLWFGSTDPSLTQNPKRNAGLIGEATETYGATGSGMKLHLMASPNGEADPLVPPIVMTLMHTGISSGVGRVGIGTQSPDDELEVHSDSPAFRIQDTDGGASDSYFRLEASTALGLIDYYGDTDATIRFSPRSVGGAGTVTMDFFRSTTTSGDVYMDIMRGDGSTDKNARIGANVDSYFNVYDGDVGIGTSSPLAKLHIRDDHATTTTELLKLENTSTGDATAQFIISGQTWTMGIDNSFSDRFSIRASDQLNGSALFQIEPDGDIDIVGDTSNEVRIGGSASTNQTTLAFNNDGSTFKGFRFRVGGSTKATVSQVANTTGLEFQTGGTSVAMNIRGSGGASDPVGKLGWVELEEALTLKDSKKILFGTGNDASILYDGTNMLFDSQEVGSGFYHFQNSNALFEGEVTSNTTGSVGWSIQSSANQACTTTCTFGAVHGWDTASGEVAVSASDSTADKCLCAGAS